MRCKKVLKLSLITIILLSNAFILLADTKDESDNKSRNDEKSLYQAAELKKQIFRWELAVLRDIKFAEKQVESLRAKRLEIQKAIERLEFIAKMQKKTDDAQPPSVKLTKGDETSSEDLDE